MIFVSFERATHDLLLVINSNLDPISHLLATVHPWQTDRQINRQTHERLLVPIARPLL